MSRQFHIQKRLDSSVKGYIKMNCVSINLKKDEILIKIDENSKHDEILNELNSKLIELKKLYQDEKTPIRVTGKILKNVEMEELKETIKREIDVEIRFDTPQTMGLHSITRSYKKDIGISETKFHKGSLRSGQRMEVEGSIVIIGDVNSGAEVIATDNIVVIGTLRGLAHAGAKGNKEAIIAASTLDAVQLRISNIVKEIDKDKEEMQEHAYIYVEGDEIVGKFLHSAY